jgi:hypothetical protein
MAPEFISHGRRVPELKNYTRKNDSDKGKGKEDEITRTRRTKEIRGFRNPKVLSI